MPDFDLPLDGLRERRAADTTPEDFDAFWSAGIDRARALGRRRHSGKPVVEPVDTGLTTISTYDVTFPGYGGEPVRGWLHLPRHRHRHADGPLPAVVRYIGYGGGRGLPHEDVLWASAGYAYFVMDTRGQGSDWGRGDTADPHGSEPSYPGFMTRGIGRPEDYYYRRVTIDAVRAVDAVATFAEVDAERIAVVGTSQGGGLALATAGLHPAVRAAMIDVPFLCDFPRAAHIAQRGPYTELAAYLRMRRSSVAAVRRTLAYFDGVSHAQRATAPALFSVALMDDICPPSTVFAAYNVYGGAKEIEVYEFNNHEGGGAQHSAVQLKWLARLLPDFKTDH